MKSIDPATGRVIWEGAETTSEELAKAVAVARDVQPGWERENRLPYLEAYRQQLESHKQLLAETISMEMGKPLWESLAEVDAMMAKIPISIEAHKVRCGEWRRGNYVARHRPHGVVAVFGPFNFPGHLPNGHIVPALLAGNTVLFKPSEETPRVGELLQDLWKRADLPPGVLQVIQGGPSLGEALATSAIDGLFFTGSAAVGQKLRGGVRPGAILALEMGGNNPLVVWECSEIRAAAYMTLVSAFITSGQRCTCARRLILPKGATGDELLHELETLMDQVTVGPYTQNPFMGPVTKDRDNPFQRPTLFEDDTFPDQEIFAPRLRVIRVETFEAAVAEANRTRFGLAATLISDQRPLFDRFRRRVHAGVINFNAPTTGASSALPFGGLGESGNHRPSALYAADYCAYPVASHEEESCTLPETPYPGIFHD